MAQIVPVDYFVQARMSSSRLPNKVLLPLENYPVLYHVCHRVSLSKYARRVAVLTSVSSEDDAIEAMCLKYSIECYRGDLHDVLDRYYCAAVNWGATHIGRITADCPCIDPVLLDALVEYYFQGAYDYASNAVEPTLPDGFDAELFSFATLETMWKNAKLQFQREHVTQYVHQNLNAFRVGSWKAPEDNSRYRVTLDTELDYQVIREIYSRLYSAASPFTFEDVIGLLRSDPTLGALNTHLERNSSLKDQIREQLLKKSE